MAAGDIYQIAFNQEISATGEPIGNVFHYLCSTGAGTASNLAGAFLAVGSVKALINVVQDDAVINRSIRVINLFSLSDFHEADVSGAGGYAADMLPPESAISYTFKLNTRGVRPGGKRISGVPEAYGTGGLITDATYLTALNALRVAFSTMLVGLGDPEYTPIVVKRIRMEPDEDHPNVRYRLPVDAEEANYGVVTSALLNTRISHQVSRGNGR